jgi:tetratricopeptide (TPR) repeat protein
MALTPPSINSTLFNRRCLLFTLLLVNLVWPGGVAGSSDVWGEAYLPQVLPEREIRQQGPAVTQWHALWLQARSAVRQDDFTAAVQIYEKLLAIKPNLEEARWELTKIWLGQHEWEKAARLLERLLEADADRVAYLNALAAILQGKAYHSRSVELFSRALKKEPENIESMEGIIQSLVKLRRKGEALPYLKRLHLLKPADRRIRQDLARISYENGELELARAHLAYLAEGPESDIALLEMAARTHERLGLDNLAISYRLRILAWQAEHQESHDRLARYYQKTGQAEEALYHFQALLARNPANPSLLHAIGRLLEDSGRFAEALPYFERYLALRPEDRKVLGTIVNLHTALGERAEILASLERLFAVDTDPEPAKVKLAAQLYAEAGRLDKAIPFYRRVLAVSPDDREAVAALAAALTATGNADSALSLWRHLTELEPGRLEAYQAMAEILLSQERHDELILVLERIHVLNPDDELVALKLASVYLEKDEVAKGKLFLEKIREGTSLQAEYLEIRGAYFERDFQPGHALRVYETLLELNPAKEQIRLKCVQLAGELGKLADLRRHLEMIGQSGSNIRIEMAAAEALVNCGVYDEALRRYQLLLGNGKGAPGAEREEILLAMAALYRRAGLPYEAEQALRMILPHGREVSVAMVGLFDLALAAGSLAEAQVWLDQLRNSGYSQEEDLLAARLLSAKGEHRHAIRIGRRFATELTGSEAPAQRQQHPGLLLGRLLLAAGRLTEAKHHLLALAGENHPAQELERLVLLQQITYAAGEAGGEKAHAEAMALAIQDLGPLLHLASLYGDAGLTDQFRQVAQQAVATAPESLRARFYLIASYQAARESGPALAAVRHITSNHPGHVKATALETTLLFQAGRFQETETLCGIIAADDPYYPQQQLLKGRALWRQNRWQESMAVYEDFLKPPISELFDERSAARGVYYLPDITRTSIWQLLSYKESEPDVFINRVMAASYAADNSSQRQRDLNAAAAPLFARYRWQERFASELTARRSVSRREYFLAIKQFEGLLKAYPEEDSLMFDLAGLYSHQGVPGEEAVLYRRIAALNPEFPGLREAVQRNRLKRKPRLLLGYDRWQEEGRAGQKAIRQEQGEIGAWFSPALQQELDFSASRIFYQSTEDDRNLRANRAFLSYRADFNENISLRVGGGVESPGGSMPSTGLLDWEVIGRIGDKWTSYLSFARDVTTDTMASLTRNIVRHDFRTGLGIDILPRLLVGGDYHHTDFSDSNFIQSYDLWASYIILTEPTFLKLNYLYRLKDSREGARPGMVLADGFAADDHPYWTPTDYWVNQVSFYFKHLLSNETFGRGIPRYYTLEYSLGHDSDGEAIQSLKGGFFLEWTQRFIMEAAAEITSSEPYRQNALSLSGIYRW